MKRACLLLVCALGGCAGDAPGQVEAVQGLANALRVRGRAGVQAACAQLVKGLRDPLSCDGVLVPLLHYSPHFPGSKVERAGRNLGWFARDQVRVPVRYQGAGGGGSLEVTLRREAPSRWYISAILPK